MEISSKNGKYNNATSKKKLNEFNLSDINEDEIERLTLTSIEATTGGENSNNNNNNFFLNDFDNSKSISHKQQPQAAAKNRINFKMSTMNSNEDSLNNSNKNSNLSMFKNNTAQTSDMTTLMHNNTNDNTMNNNNNNNNTTNFFSNGPNSPFSLNRYGPNRNYGHSSRSTMEFYRLKLSRSKLKAVTRTSALLSGFAMVAMVELNLDYSDYFESILKENNKLTTASSTTASTTLMLSNSTVNSTLSTGTTTRLANVDVSDEVKKFLVPESVLILYALVTCLLVGVHMLALMISTCILPQIEATSFEQIDLEQFYEQRQHFLSNQQNLGQQMSADATTNKQQPQHQTNNDNLLLNESKMARAFNNTASNHDLADVVFPYNQFHRFIELAWISSTVLGIFLFLVEIGLVCYIKFYPISFVSALTGAVVMLPILVLFVAFTITFYKKLAHFKLNLTKHYLHQVDRNLQPLGGDHVI